MTTVRDDGDLTNAEAQPSTSHQHFSGDASTAHSGHDESHDEEGADKENKSIDHEEANDDSSSDGIPSWLDHEPSEYERQYWRNVKAQNKTYMELGLPPHPAYTNPNVEKKKKAGKVRKSKQKSPPKPVRRSTRLAPNRLELTGLSLENQHGAERRDSNLHKEQVELASQRTNTRLQMCPHDDLAYADYHEDVFHDCVNGENCELESTPSDILKRACHIVQIDNEREACTRSVWRQLDEVSSSNQHTTIDDDCLALMKTLVHNSEMDRNKVVQKRITTAAISNHLTTSDERTTMIVAAGDSQGHVGLALVDVTDESIDVRSTMSAPFMRRVSGLSFGARDEESLLYACSNDGSVRALDMEKQMWLKLYCSVDNDAEPMRHLLTVRPGTASPIQVVATYYSHLLFIDRRSSASPQRIRVPFAKGDTHANDRPRVIVQTNDYDLVLGGSAGTLKCMDMRRMCSDLATFDDTLSQQRTTPLWTHSFGVAIDAMTYNHADDVAYDVHWDTSNSKYMSAHALLVSTRNNQLHTYRLGKSSVTHTLHHDNNPSIWVEPLRPTFVPGGKDTFLIANAHRDENNERFVEVWSLRRHRVMHTINGFSTIPSLVLTHRRAPFLAGFNASGYMLTARASACEAMDFEDS